MNSECMFWFSLFWYFLLYPDFCVHLFICGELKLTTRNGIPPLLKALWRPLDLLFPQLWRHSPCIFSILYYKYNTVSFYLDIITIYCKTENVLDSAHFNNNVLNNNIRFLKINSIKVLWKMKAAWTVSCMHAICLSIHILWIENNLILTFFSAI